MTRWLRACAWLLAAAALASGTSCAPKPAASQRQLLEVIPSDAFPSIEGAQWGWLFGAWQGYGEWKDWMPSAGWLSGEDGGERTLLGVDGVCEQLREHGDFPVLLDRSGSVPVRPPPHGRHTIYFVAESFEAAVDRALARGELLPDIGPPAPAIQTGKFGPSGFLMLAWFCDVRGDSERTKQCLERAIQLAPDVHDTRGSSRAHETGPHQRLSPALDQLAAEVEANTNRGANAGHPRALLARRMEAAAKMTSHDTQRARRETLAKQLREMSREGENRAPLGAEELLAHPLEERIEEWIYRMRDLRAVTHHSKDYCRALSAGAWPQGPDGQDLQSPARALKGAGEPAVRRLLDLLDDTRPTRCLDANWAGTGFLLEHRDVAFEILQAMGACAGVDGPTWGPYLSQCKEASQIVEGLRRLAARPPK